MNKQIINLLIRILGPKAVLFTPEDLATYSYDGTFVESNPGVVVLPETTQQVSQVVQLAAEKHLPVVPRGMGSGLAAGSVPFPDNSVVISLTRMNHTREIDTLNAIVKTEAGVITADLQAAVEKHGLFYPPDPSSIRHSTIGGNIACNAGGPRCLKYGVTGDYVLGLTVVLADGRVLNTGGEVIKDVTGYDLKRLFTGSEGTLGLITEATLRLIAKPQFTRTALIDFVSLENASQTVNAVLSSGIVPATLELMDQTALVCIEQAMKLGLETNIEASLLIETDGNDERTVAHEIENVVRVCEANGARSVKLAQGAAERDKLWLARRSISPSLARKAPNKLGEDITVPRSAIPEVIRKIRGISAHYELPIVIFGHAGDGNLHPNILFDKRQPDQWEKVEAMVAEIFEAALAVGGTLSGEHGIGTLKLPYLEKALGPVSIDVQKQIKTSLDPNNIFNPGKMFID
ncbi:MAG: FAD-binding protein [Anaerolineales bacterium]|nr:MAG: FAD-binding protein [Anaerolineales bacterium]